MPSPWKLAFPTNNSSGFPSVELLNLCCFSEHLNILTVYVSAYHGFIFGGEIEEIVLFILLSFGPKINREEHNNLAPQYINIY